MRDARTILARPVGIVSLCLSMATLFPVAAAAQQVAERHGNIEYTDALGRTRRLTSDGGFGEPSLGPDGRTVAYLQRSGLAPSTLWVANGISAERRAISLAGIAANGEDGAEYSRPAFSLDGGFVYVTESAAAPGSASVLQFRLTDGRMRRVIGGSLLSVMRTGPYRGYLLVQQHRYYRRGGSYNPVYVVRPDARQTFVIPGSQNEDGESAVAPWLRQHGWRAW